jgi:tRNA G18 (ribose-2'-O)-methylase SpoU
VQIRLDDPDDPRLDPYRNVRDRDLVGRRGRFMAEGRVVLEKLVGAAPDLIESILAAEGRAPGLEHILKDVPAGVPIYLAAQPVMDQVVGFPIHRGILAIGRRPDRDPAEVLRGLPPRALVVGLVGIANHDNMGGLFRNAAAFGAGAVLLDETCCDPLYRKAIRVSVGAALTVPFCRVGSAGDLLDRLAAEGFEPVALSPSGDLDLSDLRPAPRTAVLFGAEGPGLSPDLLARVRSVRIAMAGGFDSLNVATTSGIVLHALTLR